MKTVKEGLDTQYFATGVQLDKFGELYGVHRIVESDAEYRLRLIEEFNNVNKQLMEDFGDKSWVKILRLIY